MKIGDIIGGLTILRPFYLSSNPDVAYGGQDGLTLTPTDRPVDPVSAKALIAIGWVPETADRQRVTIPEKEGETYNHRLTYWFLSI